jgi:hypothetical protein
MLEPALVTVVTFTARRHCGRIRFNSIAPGNDMSELQRTKSHLLALTIFLALFFCVDPVVADFKNHTDKSVPSNKNKISNSLENLARAVTIYRDTYGVPHVFGRTDASTVVGFAYAQAEDNFWRVEEKIHQSAGTTTLRRMTGRRDNFRETLTSTQSGPDRYAPAASQFPLRLFKFSSSFLRPTAGFAT